jgi:hypothetical protein
MAVIFMDGFDHYSDEGIGGDTEVERNAWTQSILMNGTLPSTRFTSYNGRMLKSTSTGGQTLTKTGLSTSNDTVLGFAMYEWETWGAARFISLLGAVGVTILQIRVDTSGYVRMYSDDGSTLIAGPTTGSLNLSTWYYFELVKTATTAELLIDGESWLSATGQSFSLTGGFTIELQSNAYLDDVYITNTSTPLDAPRIITLYPNEAGTNTDWKNTFREVEAPGGYAVGIDEEYISSDTSTEKESWKYNELPPGSWDIYAVGPVVRVKNNGAGTPSLKITCKNTGGLNTPNTTVVPTDTFTHTKHIESTKDGSLDWDVTAINSLEMIVEYV